MKHSSAMSLSSCSEASSSSLANAVGSCVYKLQSGASEWFEAVEAYKVARDDDTVTEAHREQVRATWQVIKDQVELDNDQQALMDEVMRI